jgi:hypothetical protein
MIELDSRFANDLPLGCPLEGAKPVDLVAYRLVRSNPPAEADFIPEAIAKPRRYKHCDAGTLCKARGLSIASTLEGAKALSKIPSLSDAVIAEGRISPETGVVADTPSPNCSDHCTWWPYEGIRAHELFSIIREAR